MVPLDPTFLARPIAHRGLHDAAAGRPENSRAAILAAVEAGYGIEIDLQPCANGTPMVFHDYALDRLTDAVGPIRGLPCAELQALKLAGTDEGIPTLAEVLDLVAGRVPLLIEIKDQDGQLGPAVGALEAQVGAVLKGYAGPVAVMSFNPNSVRVMQEHAPDVARGLVTDAFQKADWPLIPPARRARLALIPDLGPAGASFVSHNRKHLDATPLRAVKARGQPVLTWTVRSEEEAFAAGRVADQLTFEGYLP